MQKRENTFNLCINQSMANVTYWSFFSQSKSCFFLDDFYQFILLVFVCFVLNMHKFIRIINKNAV
jgi:hypothetical protein